MYDNNAVLGWAPCLLQCGHDMVVKLSEKSQLAYGHCHFCKTQIFARSGRSDELLRNTLPPAKASPAPASKAAPPLKLVVA
jgi:hypothetical protein